MKAARVDNGVVVNLIVIDNENFKALKAKGYDLIASEPLGLQIGDYTEDGRIFHRDIPVYDSETGERTGTVKTPLPLEENEAADMLNALETLGYEEVTQDA